jgi:hypothetical protein
MGYKDMMNRKVLLMLFLVIGSVLLSGCVNPMTTLAVSTPLPIDIDYGIALPNQQSGNYWRVSAYVDGSGESYILNMPQSKLLSGDTKAQKDLILTFTPTQPYWHADTFEDPFGLEYNYITYSWFWGYGVKRDDVPYTRVSGVGQTINVGYTATLTDADGKKIVDGGEIHNFNVDGDGVGTLQLKAKDSNGITRTTYITLNGLIPAGILTPRGELATVFDGTDARSDSSHDMVNYITLKHGVAEWNTYIDSSVGPAIAPIEYMRVGSEWVDTHSWLVNHGLSSQIPSTQVIKADFEGVGALDGSTPTGIRIYYGIGTFKPSITAYIPEELAETITETKQAPHPQIKEIKKLTVAEGGSVNFKVVVQNLGSAGDVQVMASSKVLKNLKTMGDSTAYIGAGKEYTWMFTGDVADEVTDTEKEDIVIVTANGGVSGQFGTTDSIEVPITVMNADVSVGDMPTLHITTTYEDSGEPFESASIFVGYGSGARVGTGQADVQIIKGIEYAVYSEDTSGFLAQYTAEEPKLVTAYTDKNIVIEFNEERPEQDNDFWVKLLCALGALGALLLLWRFGVFEMLITNPLYILILVLILVILWATVQITETVETAKDAIQFWK